MELKTTGSGRLVRGRVEEVRGGARKREEAAGSSVRQVTLHSLNSVRVSLKSFRGVSHALIHHDGLLHLPAAVHDDHQMWRVNPVSRSELVRIFSYNVETTFLLGAGVKCARWEKASEPTTCRSLAPPHAPLIDLFLPATGSLPPPYIHEIMN
ncbi:unnamed protein product [Danaus chrysippus]|uniref:(African queen) hypothetical protein n=1 Tax=Danaus chrysippus TaxID=151541 RepID=A0A8J2R583_9NEOP|nr:unnamed protein product [Danaus chrysippus]